MKRNTAGRVDGQTRTMRDLHATNGLVAGSLIFTQDGELPVEFLGAGDRVITRDAGMVEIVAVRSRRVYSRIVAISAGSLGHTKPEQDCVLLACQQVLVRDWRAEALSGKKAAMVPAAELVDGEFIVDKGETLTTIYEIEFAEPHVLYADGLEVASYIATDVMADAA